MNNLDLLQKRDIFYQPLLKKLSKKNIKFNHELLLYEISLKKNEILNIKKFTKEYLLQSLNSYFNLKIGINEFDVIKYKNLILNLPNITPNGVVMPKKENLFFYNKLQNYLFKLMDKYMMYEICKKIELCEVRLMRSNNDSYDPNRSYSSSKIHSDTWSGNPCDSKVALYVDGDKENTIRFFKPKKINLSFFKKKRNYKTAIKNYGSIPIKFLDPNKLTIFDQACLHQTYNKNTDIRLSVDFGVILKNTKIKKIFTQRYKGRFLNKRKISTTQLRKVFNVKSIFEKY